MVALVWAGTSGVFNTASGNVHIRYAQIRSVNLQPVPEGPQGPLFVPRPHSSDELPLTLVRQFLIEPLPAPLDQGLHCSGGGDLIITLNSGRQVIYGPCRWPWQVSELLGRDD